jgi:predicted Zn-dependent protease
LQALSGKIIAFVCAAVVALTSSAPAFAQQRRSPQLQLLSDAETDYVIRGMTRAVFQAAGVSPDAVRIYLVNDRTLNAFVAGGQNIFLHTGLLLEADALELTGVIAHETGHISGGHLVRGKDAMDSALLASLIGLGIGIIGGVAAGNANAGMGGVLLGQQLAERSFLAFSRGQEAAADQAGMGFLFRANLSPEGMLTFLKKLDAENPVLSTDRDVGYRLTHPLTRERIEAVRQAVAQSPFTGKPVVEKWREGYARVQAKLFAYLDPGRALARFREDDRSIVARYGRAYAYFRRGDVRAALPLVDGLIKDEPKNAFFHELKGDLMLQNGRAADAAAPYRAAVANAPDSAPIRVSLAHALVETGDVRQADEAIRNLDIAGKSLPQSSFLWRLTAQAWTLKGNEGMVAYAAAEEAFAGGDKGRARVMAERAVKLLPAGSPGRLRAQDIAGQLRRGGEGETR